MKKIILFSFLALAFLVSCTQKAIIDNADQVGISKVTHYITFSLTDGPVVTFPKGTAFVDPGVVAMEGTKDVSSKVQTQGTVGTSVGLYSLTYVAVNSDGFSSTTSRTVIVYDPAAPATDLTGTYTSNVQRIKPAATFKNLTVTITKMAPGFFYTTDFIGGYYDQGRSYGSAYAFPGYFQLNADNTITIISSSNQGWSSTITSLTPAVYSPGANQINWDAFALGYDFRVVLVKQ